jgi:uncharacterized protein YecT (DUF1311 family)
MQMMRLGREKTVLAVALWVPAIFFGSLASSTEAAGRAGGAYTACMAKANSTRAMQVCQQAGLADANARLAVAYAKALATLPTDQQAKLREAQRRWIAFRSSDCDVFYGKQSGTIATIEGGDCLIDRTDVRINNLLHFGQH